MSMTKGAPESSQIIWLEDRVKKLEEGMWALNQALTEWFEKTEWVQESIQPKELGLHCADVLRQRIERLTTQRDALLEALKALLPVLDKAWDFDGDVFGRLHNDAVDADARARAAIKAAEEST